MSPICPLFVTYGSGWGSLGPNAAWAGKIIGKLKADWFSIPERFPDLNPIENLFNLVRKELNKQALSRNISTKSFQEFIIHTKLKMN